MFNPFNRARTGLRQQYARPVLEALERRDCPSALGMQPAQELWYLLNTAPPRTPAASIMKPKDLIGGGGGGILLSLQLAYNTQNSVTLSGTVEDGFTSNQGVSVYFSGEATGTAVTGAGGSFSLTTNASGLGVVSAYAVDSTGHQSNTARVTISVAAPVISNFTAVEEEGQMFTFSGNVTAQSAPGLTITFGGIPSLQNQTTTVQANSTFSFSVQLNSDGSDNGTATAQVLSDWWGQQSNVATTSVVVSS
jgi:hypothetical protein